MAGRHREGSYLKKSLLYQGIYFLVSKGLLDDDVGEGVEGHRISGGTAGSWFQNRRFR